MNLFYIAMKDSKLFVLNLITIISFVFYAIGIYLQVVFQGIEWGNLAVYTLLQIFGNELGVIMVVVIGAGILLALYLLPKFEAIDIFMCWFFIFSLYQCAINSFLQFNGLPDEPINQFFKLISPDFWYPVKEIVFIIVSFLLTVVWFKRILKKEIKKTNIILISILSVVLIIIISLSQLLLINV